MSNFWKTLEISLTKCEITIIWIWSSTCVITNSTATGTFSITNTKLYVPVYETLKLYVTLSTQDSGKLIQQLKSGFKGTMIWNRYQSKEKLQTQNPYLGYLFHTSFQKGNRLFVLSFEDMHMEQYTQDIFIHR